MDCGNKAVTVETNSRILGILEEEGRLDPVPASATVTNSVILPPCHIGEGVVIERSVIGPHVTLGAGTVVTRRPGEQRARGRGKPHRIRGAGRRHDWRACCMARPSDDASIGDYCTVGNPG